MELNLGTQVFYLISEYMIYESIIKHLHCLCTGDSARSQFVVFFYQDETVFNAHDAHTSVWVDPMGSSAIRPKGKGKGIMVSDYIEEYGGYLRLSEEELSEARQQWTAFPKQARKTLEFQRDGYWDAESFLENVKTAVRIAEFKYPRER